MTLHPLARALGGDVYAGGCRASVPAPGHSPADRSISLLLTDGRLVIHGFGSTDWREARNWLFDQGFIDATGQLTDRGLGPVYAGHTVARPDRAVRLAAALSLWAAGGPLESAPVAGRYLSRRGLEGIDDPMNLRFHPRTPTSIYRSGAAIRSALMARISDGEDRLTAVELTYLDPNGARATGLRLSRKTIGTVPHGAAVRLAPWASEMLVAEGVVTTLSAMRRFGLPGWALRAADNLAAWTPPPGVRRVLIAADTGAVGLRAAERLRIRLRRAGVRAAIRAPRPMFSDWNAVDVAERDRPPGG